MTSWALAIPFAFMLLAFVIKQPIGLGMIVGGIVYFLVKGLSFSAFVNSMAYNVFSSYVLLAIPLFVFTANIMNSGKVTEKIYTFANGLMGRFRGGSAHVNIVASLIFAGMTGSALADASGLGLIEIKQMDKEGYDRPFSCAITAATAVVGPIFPPSIQMVVFAMISGASVGKLFVGGMIPAFLLCLILGIYVVFISRKRNYPYGVKTTGKQFAIETLHAIPALLTPVVLLVGIYTGVMTPTEAGSVAAVYVILISLLIYHTFDMKSLWGIIRNTVISTGQIFLIIVAAYIFTYIINLEQAGNAILTFVNQFNLSKAGFIIFINILFLLLGMIVDINVSTLVVIPLILPLVKHYGIDLTYFGVMITLNLMIGLITPPFGMLLFITSGIGNCSMKALIREIMPMIIMELMTLALISVFPQLILFFANKV